MALFEFKDFNTPSKDKRKTLKFRPTTFDEYIGQTNAKDTLQRYISSAKEMNTVFPHLLIYGESGTGKSTLAKILASSLGVPSLDLVAGDLDKHTDWATLIKKAKGGIIHIDEIHGLERSLAEKLYAPMEDYTLGNFTLVGSTNLLGELQEDRGPLVSRFKMPILRLEKYDWKELSLIGVQYNKRLFPDFILPEETIKEIAFNSRGIPRNLERLLNAVVYFKGDYKTAFRNVNIIKYAFTYDDLKVLKYIQSSISGVGLQSIGSYLGTDTKNYLYEIEPYLLQNDLIIRQSKGRKITEKGIKYIEALERIINETNS